MLIKKSSAKEIRNSEECAIWEYGCPSELLSFATAFIDGRWPENGRNANMECEEVYYVLTGSGIVHSEKGDFNLSEGDLYFFEKGETYWTEGKKLSLVLVNVPKWTPEQHKLTN